jgi:hypothetical protein
MIRCGLDQIFFFEHTKKNPGITNIFLVKTNRMEVDPTWPDQLDGSKGNSNN